MVIEDEIKNLEFKQLHWDVFYPNVPVKEMEVINEFIQVAKAAVRIIKLHEGNEVNDHAN